jgi:hypothetical protein
VNTHVTRKVGDLKLLARVRKAIAAFVLPFLALPLADWIAGVPIDWQMFIATFATAIIAAFGVWFTPNAE